jgi:hypothetical protein
LRKSVTDTVEESALLSKRATHRTVETFCMDRLSTGQKKSHDVTAEKLDDIGAQFKATTRKSLCLLGQL